MIRMARASIGICLLLSPFTLATSEGAGRKVAAQPEPATPGVARVQDCSTLYDPYHSRGFGPGSGPDSNAGFGMFEGALPAYPMNSFPNWYGLCATWGHYGAAGSAPR